MSKNQSKFIKPAAPKAPAAPAEPATPSKEYFTQQIAALEAKRAESAAITQRYEGALTLVRGQLAMFYPETTTATKSADTAKPAVAAPAKS